MIIFLAYIFLWLAFGFWGMIIAADTGKARVNWGGIMFMIMVLGIPFVASWAGL